MEETIEGWYNDTKKCYTHNRPNVKIHSKKMGYLHLKDKACDIPQCLHNPITSKTETEKKKTIFWHESAAKTFSVSPKNLCLQGNYQKQRYRMQTENLKQLKAKDIYQEQQVAPLLYAKDRTLDTSDTSVHWIIHEENLHLVPIVLPAEGEDKMRDLVVIWALNSNLDLQKKCIYMQKKMLSVKFYTILLGFTKLWISIS